MGAVLPGQLLGRAALLSAVSLVACSSDRGDPTPAPAATTAPTVNPPPGAGGAPPLLVSPPAIERLDLGAACDPGRAVGADSAALLVRYPSVLSRFSLERVLSQIITTAEGGTTPVELLQRLFDTENSAATGAFADGTHCDDTTNPAFSRAPAVDCPRAEGALALSAGLLTPGSPDSFFPVAIVNRFDLLPETFETCGEFRIVYAKESGRTDAENRLFLILEGALENAGREIASCRPVAELWAGLDALAPSEVADRLDEFFFTGLAGFAPAVHARHYGLNGHFCSYSGTCGQLRIGQRMQAPWQFRQFRLREHLVEGLEPNLRFEPTPVTGTPRGDLFDTDSVEGSSSGPSFRRSLGQSLGGLVRGEVARLHLDLGPEYDSGESAIEGGASPDYSARVPDSATGAEFLDQISTALVKLELPRCPPLDPMTPDAIFERAAALSCAGCHAPDRLLPEERAVGCDLTWPASLGETHVDEHGQLSPALTNVFLPHRADVLGTFLRACDETAIRRNLQPVRDPPRLECFAAGTPITMADGSTRPIERVEVGDAVLGYDWRTRAFTEGRVERAVLRPDADRLVVVNGSVLATTNHRFYTDRGLLRADSLTVGDVLLGVASRGVMGEPLLAEPRTVRELVLCPSSAATYNIEVGPHHTYFAGGLLVDDR